MSILYDLDNLKKMSLSFVAEDGSEVDIDELLSDFLDEDNDVIRESTQKFTALFEVLFEGSKNAGSDEMLSGFTTALCFLEVCKSRNVKIEYVFSNMTIEDLADLEKNTVEHIDEQKELLDEEAENMKSVLLELSARILDESNISDKEGRATGNVVSLNSFRKKVW